METYSPDAAVEMFERRAFEAENENYHSEAGVLWEAVALVRKTDCKTVFFLSIDGDYDIFMVDPGDKEDETCDPGPISKGWIPPWL
jgi:hypothetical protein